MTNKEFVINRFPDARVVYGASGKPSIMSDSFIYQSKKGADISEAWDNAANDIKSLNFQKRFFNDEETVKYFYPNAVPIELHGLGSDIKWEITWAISYVKMNQNSLSIPSAWAEAAQLCKENYEFWSKKKWHE